VDITVSNRVGRKKTKGYAKGGMARKKTKGMKKGGMRKKK
jgi:hypothetical protein